MELSTRCGRTTCTSNLSCSVWQQQVQVAPAGSVEACNSGEAGGNLDLGTISTWMVTAAFEQRKHPGRECQRGSGPKIQLQEADFCGGQRKQEVGRRRWRNVEAKEWGWAENRSGGLGSQGREDSRGHCPQE